MLQRIAACLVLALSANAEAQAPLLAAIFDDHGVLQRDRPSEIWGRANPNEQVTVTFSNVTRTTQSDASGHWTLTIPTFRAGGPHVLTARTATRTQTVRDVLVGDVWLCSGQSNMEWTVAGTLNAYNEVRFSQNPSIRHVKIPVTSAPEPRADFPARLQWQVAGPKTTQDFSAVCYYFARELQKTTNVPQGLINATLGGSRIETWLSAEKLRSLGGNDAKLDLLAAFARDRAAAAARWGDEFEKWWRPQAVTQGLEPWAIGQSNIGAWQPAPAMLGPWEQWNEAGLGQYDGLLWYRTRVDVTRAQARQAATLVLGEIGDTDLVWLNGHPIAGGGFREEQRAYVLPARLLRPGENTIVVSVHNLWGRGGLLGPPEKLGLEFTDGSSVRLDQWLYQKAPAGLTSIPRGPWEPVSGLTVDYNGMIAPLRQFGLRGVAWYQGESNAGREDALRYEQLLRALMDDWRRQFAAPLPFFVVQLANYGKVVAGPVDSGWARVRDAQRRAVAADGNAGLAVTIDVGNAYDLHPTNKQDVGLRLARVARHVAFGAQASASGAQPKSAKRAVNGVDVAFGDHDGSLVVMGAKDPAGFELCGEQQESCRFVRAWIEGAVVHLEDAAPGTATRVRYCWADAPVCNFYDTDGLPVGPFEFPID
jgi:sialate O-acetylesterase